MSRKTFVLEIFLSKVLVLDLQLVALVKKETFSQIFFLEIPKIFGGAILNSISG